MYPEDANEYNSRGFSFEYVKIKNMKLMVLINFLEKCTPLVDKI